MLYGPQISPRSDFAWIRPPRFLNFGMLPSFKRLCAHLICLGVAWSIVHSRAAEAPPAAWATFLSGWLEGMFFPKIVAEPGGGFYVYSTGDRPLIKFSGAGVIAWEARHEAGVNDVREVVQMAVLDDGDVIAIVTAGQNARVFGQQFVNDGRWLVRLRASDGSPVFVKPIENCEITAVSGRPGGGFFVAGFTLGAARIGSDELLIPTNKVFVAQFTAGVDWVATGEWNGFDDKILALRRSGVGAASRIWVAGNATKPWTFGSKTFAERGVYVLQLNEQGTVVDGRVVSQNDVFAVMELRPSGGAHIATKTQVIRVNGDGSVAWAKPFTGEVTAATASDETYVAGHNMSASFVLALDSAGNQKWRRDEFSRSVNMATGAAVLSDGRLAISGGAEPEGIFINDFFLGDFAAIDVTYSDGFVATFDVRSAAPPVFAEQPRDEKMAIRSERVELRANVYSPTSVSFQWYKDGTKLTGQTSSNLILLNVQSAQAGKYFVEASNATATTRSREVEVVVNTVIVSTVAGTDGAGTFEQPRGVAKLLDGSILVADSSRHNIKRVSATGVSTFAGAGVAGFVDGLPLEAQFSSPSAVAVEWRHEAPFVYVADRGNDRVRRIRFSAQSGEAVSVESLEQLADVSAAATSDAINAAVFGSDASGSVWEIAGLGPRILPANAALGRTGGVAMDERRNVFVADLALSEIRRISPGGEVLTVASQLSQPRGMALDDSGNIYVVESGAHRITKVAPGGTKTVVAGTGVGGVQNGGGAEAMFNAPDGICFRAGALIVADTGNRCLREIRFTPVNASASDPEIGIEVSGGLLISVSGAAGATFVIESADKVGLGAQWRFEGNVVGESNQRLALSAPGSTRFYRARRSP
jgi:hypothetical protein